MRKMRALLLLGRSLSGLCVRLRAGGLGARAHAGAAEAILEALHAAAAIEALAHASPSRVGLGIDVEAQARAFLAPGRPRLERRAVRHHHVDLVVVWVNLLFHAILQRLAARLRPAGAPRP